MGREMSPETKRMREEITTFAEFGANGAYEDVAAKYGVGKSTAYAWMKKLQEDGKGKFAKMETIPFTGTLEERVDAILVNPLKVSGERLEGASKVVEVVMVDNPAREDKVEVMEASEDKKYFKVEFNESNRVPGCFGECDPDQYQCEDRKNYTECLVTFGKIQGEIEHQTDHPEQYETKDDLSGLAEPEPAWTPEHNKEWSCNLDRELDVDKLLKSLSKLETEEDDEELFIEIGGWLKGIKDRTIKRAGIKFDERLAEMMAGVQG